jgi:hypothetical protein
MVYIILIDLYPPDRAFLMIYHVPRLFLINVSQVRLAQLNSGISHLVRKGLTTSFGAPVQHAPALEYAYFLSVLE